MKPYTPSESSAESRSFTRDLDGACHPTSTFPAAGARSGVEARRSAECLVRYIAARIVASASAPARRRVPAPARGTGVLYEPIHAAPLSSFVEFQPRGRGYGGFGIAGFAGRSGVKDGITRMAVVFVCVEVGMCLSW